MQGGLHSCGLELPVSLPASSNAVALPGRAIRALRFEDRRLLAVDSKKSVPEGKLLSRKLFMSWRLLPHGWDLPGGLPGNAATVPRKGISR